MKTSVTIRHRPSAASRRRYVVTWNDDANGEPQRAVVFWRAAALAIERAVAAKRDGWVALYEWTWAQGVKLDWSVVKERQTTNRRVLAVGDAADPEFRAARAGAGGRAAAAKMTKEERSASARRAALAKHAKLRAEREQAAAEGEPS